MIAVALKGLLGRKIRAILTAFAIVLGVAMITGTFIFTDTLSRGFTIVTGESYEGTDVVISGRKLVDYSASGRATLPTQLLDEVRELQSVDSAAGAIIDLQDNSDPAKLIDRDGTVIGGEGQGPTFGIGLDSSQLRFTPLELTAGTWAAGPTQVVIDDGAAEKFDFAVGDTIGVSATGPVKEYRITGIARYGSVGSIGNSTFAVFDVPTAQALYNKEERFDSISVAAKDGISPEQLAREIRSLLPATAEVKTGLEQSAADAKDAQDGIALFRSFLLAFGGIALFVGAFVIFNTLSITVAQRTRELATLRTLGASRRQVLRSVVLEGFVIGLVASLLGLALGLAVGKGLNALFVAFGVDLPHTGTIVAPRTVIVGLLVGVGITVVAGLIPALRATRVPPISAVREGATMTPSRLARYTTVLAFATIGIGAVAIGYGLFVDGLDSTAVILALGVGSLAIFVGVALLASKLVRPLAAVVGLPAWAMGGTAGQLARENAMRNPSRTAATSAALMIGLALVTVVAVLGHGLEASSKRAVAAQLQADYVVTTENRFEPFSASAGQAVAAAEGVGVVSNVRSDRARIDGEDVDVSGIEPQTIGRFYRFRWAAGNDPLSQLGTDGAIVQETFAEEHQLKVGSQLAMRTPGGTTLGLVVVGISDPPRLDPLLAPVNISRTAFDAAFPQPRNMYTFVDVAAPGDAASAASLKQSLTEYPDATLLSSTAFEQDRMDGFSTFLSLLYVLLALSIVVSLFGMVNTQVLSVFERTRELGMLRAVGMTRRQTRRMIRHESVITGLIGAALGIPLGLVLAALVTRALSQYDVQFSVPTGTLVVFTIVAITAGVIAAVLPARRAARLHVLNALHHE
jgi:putative ABC transport system permease protein